MHRLIYRPELQTDPTPPLRLASAQGVAGPRRVRRRGGIRRRGGGGAESGGGEGVAAQDVRDGSAGALHLGEEDVVEVGEQLGERLRPGPPPGLHLPLPADPSQVLGQDPSQAPGQGPSQAPAFGAEPLLAPGHFSVALRAPGQV